jgi:hypothetical protein
MSQPFSVILLLNLLLLMAAPLCYWLDRRSLQRGEPAAFGRGMRIVRLQSDLVLRSRRPTELISTAEGEGKWLTDDFFAFWARADYRASSQFAWVGRAVVKPQGVLFEVRVLRSKVLILVGVLLIACAFLAGATENNLPLFVMVMEIGMSVFILWMAWIPFAEQRKLAARAVDQMRIRLEHADDDEHRRLGG